MVSQILWMFSHWLCSGTRATEEFSNSIATLKALTEQTYFDIITGVKPLDYFDTFVAEFKAAGGEAAEKSVQDAYALQMSAVEKMVN